MFVSVAKKELLNHMKMEDRGSHYQHLGLYGQSKFLSIVVPLCPKVRECLIWINRGSGHWPVDCPKYLPLSVRIRSTGQAVAILCPVSRDSTHTTTKVHLCKARIPLLTMGRGQVFWDHARVVTMSSIRRPALTDLWVSSCGQPQQLTLIQRS